MAGRNRGLAPELTGRRSSDFAAAYVCSIRIHSAIQSHSPAAGSTYRSDELLFPSCRIICISPVGFRETTAR